MTAAKPDEPLDALGSEWSVGVTRLNEFEHLFGKASTSNSLTLSAARSSQRCSGYSGTTCCCSSPG